MSQAIAAIPQLPVTFVGANSARQVAHISSRILVAWREGDDASFQAELNRAQRLSTQARGLDALETERMEVLESVVESLDERGYFLSPDEPGSSVRVRAAVRLLEHLASGSSGPVQE
jgi:hypothetical protein